MIGACYRKVMSLPFASQDIMNKATTILTQDGQKAFIACLFFHQLWSIPVFAIGTFI